jgi:hypothetical protein
VREYGQIQSSFWTHPDIQTLCDQGKLLATYLLTGPHSNGLGCFRVPNGYLSGDLGWDQKTISKGFAELFEIGFAMRCEQSSYVLIPKYLHWNPIANANVAKAREKEFAQIPKTISIYSELCKSILDYGNYLDNRFETVLERYTKQDPTQTQPNPTQDIRDISSAEEDVTQQHRNGVPFAKIIDLYHECLPMLPRVEKLTDARKGYIRQRWAQDLPNIDHWQNYFDFVSRSPFLTGQVEPKKGRPPFRADLEWLTRPGNYAKVAEEKYHGEV